MADARGWVKEAKGDLDAAKNLAQARLYSQACFHCQQAAEKALKARLVQLRGDFPKTHSLRQLAVLAGAFGELIKDIALLEGDYTLTRYPDAYGTPPAELYDAASFSKRFDAAGKVVARVEKWMKS